MASRGELGGLPAFDISASSCRRLRTAENEKRARAKRMSPENRAQVIEDLESRLVAVIADAVALIEAGQKCTVPLGQVRTLLATLRDLQAKVAKPRPENEPGQEQQRDDTPPGSGLVARLTSQATAETQGEGDADTHHGTASPARAPLRAVKPPDPAA